MSSFLSTQQKNNLRQGIEAMGILVTDFQLEKMSDYLQLLKKWNATHNLTSIDEIDAMIRLHVLDSLSVLPHIEGSNVLDVGSGGGLPGLLLAIMRPDIEFVSIDARNKKIQFQSLAAANMGLSNFSAVHSRVEGYQTSVQFDQIVSRAFASITDFLAWTHHLLKPQGEWLAMKGLNPQEELAAMDQEHYEVKTLISLDVPALNAERHLVKIAKVV